MNENNNVEQIAQEAKPENKPKPKAKKKVTFYRKPVKPRLKSEVANF